MTHYSNSYLFCLEVFRGTQLSSYALSQEKLEIHRKKYEKPVKLWEQLKSEGVSDKACQAACGMSKSTYYRYKAHLYALSKGILPPSKRPKSLRKPQWGEAEMQLVLQIQRENPTLHIPLKVAADSALKLPANTTKVAVFMGALAT